MDRFGARSPVYPALGARRSSVRKVYGLAVRQGGDTLPRTVSPTQEVDVTSSYRRLGVNLDSLLNLNLTGSLAYSTIVVRCESCM